MTYKLFKQKKEIRNLTRAAFLFEAQNNKAIGDVVAIIREIMLTLATSGSNPSLLMKKLNKQFSSRYIDDNNIISMMPSLADLYCHGLARYLRKHYIQLSPVEVSVCCMIALGISSHSISTVYGFGHYGTIYNKSLAIRKKIQVPQGTELEAFLTQLTEELRERSSKAVRKAIVEGSFKPLMDSDIFNITY